AARHFINSEHAQIVHKVLAFFGTKADAVALFVKIYNVGDGVRGAVRKIRRPGSEPAELLHRNCADVNAFAGYEAASRVLSVDYLTVVAGHSEQRQFSGGVGGFHIGSADIHPTGHACAMTRSTGGFARFAGSKRALLE